MLASVVIRTYNEERYLEELLKAVNLQKCELVELEVVLVDSGSTDRTLEIAKKFDCRITHIRKEDFTFGRSLNVGCEFARGDILIFVSGHCIPVGENWLDELCRPIIDETVSYSYGRQEGWGTTKYSEYQHFAKWFPEYNKLPQDGFFCNNANAAVSRSTWESYGFDEELTGLEDMYLARLLTERGERVGYVADASVYHIHDESWRQVRTRYEREAYALQKVMPEVHFSIKDFMRFFISGVLSDFSAAVSDGMFFSKCWEIVMFRFNHYWGTYKGSREFQKLSNKRKFHYFYPKDIEREIYNAEEEAGRAIAYEG